MLRRIDVDSFVSVVKKALEAYNSIAEFVGEKKKYKQIIFHDGVAKQVDIVGDKVIVDGKEYGLDRELLGKRIKVDAVADDKITMIYLEEL